LYSEIVIKVFQSTSGSKIDEMLFYLNSKGLNRRDIFGLLRHINLYNNTISEDESDHIGGILDNLSGFCILEEALNYIQFIDDPIDRDDKLKYIGTIGYGWPPYIPLITK
jgi:hypothetical protein